ncbi:DUF4126 domain-containing protein [uncultured Methylibium sp.]|uniref:DUF4126 domain-containing protein n=1 Tax=uncultured Methylibium sp. TaxID=381093 RepID=UPI0025F979B0|nr:DUF4126 domain-containing protein [uncultured Methylibium sp.]
MDALQALDTTQLIALAATLGWASGLRLYAVLAITGLVGYAGWVSLPPGLQLLQHPAMLAGSSLMVFAEFFADKIPGLDSLWDLVHTLLRIPAGAALAAGVFGADHATMAAVAALLGGTLAATSHAAKASTRAAVNTSPEPFSNIGLSLLGDLAVPGMLWLAFEHPVLAIVAVSLAFVTMLGVIWWLSKFLRRVWSRLKMLLGLPSSTAA